MALEPQKPKSRRKQQIEPLDWSTMSQSPALKGMVSFLEVTPEDIRRQQGRNGDSRTISDASIGSDSRTGELSIPQYAPSFGLLSESLTGSEPLIRSDSHIGPERGTIRDPRIGSATPTGSESRIGKEGLIATVSKRAAVGSADERRESHSRTGSDALTGSDTHLGIETLIGNNSFSSETPGSTKTSDPRRSELETAQQPQASSSIDPPSTPGAKIKSPRPGSEEDQEVAWTYLAALGTDTGSETRIGNSNSDDNLPNSESSIGSDTHTDSDAHIVSDTHTGSDPRRGAETRTGGKSRIVSDPYEADPRVATVSDTRIGTPAMSDSRTGGQQKPTYYVGSEQYPRPQRRMPMLQGDVVWQNRKIRKCVLAQDAHSQGEDALFSAMWNAAKPDAADPSGSRTLRIGYAELAQKSRMHRSNIRINIASLRAKLAIEVLDEHDSRDVMPRLYRLYSYKEILERRRAAGLEYVIRKKSVVFVTETGELVALPGLSKPSARRTQRALAESNGTEAVDVPANEVRAEQLDLDVRQISDAMSQHWPVDEAAAQQLLRQCRSVRRDAEIGEIVFFINEKLQIALTNKNIKNPTGLILATVPQCFEGATFQEFRRRRNEALRLAAEEQERKRRQERDLEAWLTGKMQELRAVVDDVSQSEAVRDKARRELKHYGA